MKNKYTKTSYLGQLFFFGILLISLSIQAQVGIGNTNPDASSVLDISSTNGGILIPRMTTLERIAITAPANSLMVYDETLRAYFYYDSISSSWIEMNSAIRKRDNYKLIKYAADLSQELADGGGSKYLLQTGTLYEINGTITLTKSIDINNAYVSGADANEDILSYPGGVIFKGNSGGSIRNVTLKGAKAFEITGPGIATASAFLIQNTIIDGMTTSVGSISGIGLLFANIVQYINNTNGITYSNIGNLLLNNQAWLGTNSGTFEKLTGTFGLVEKVSGFSSVKTGAIGFDVSTSGLTVPTGVLNGTVFTGTGTYVKGYAPANTYPGYNFSNAWTVDCPGIPRESDGVAAGNIYYNGALDTGFAQSIPNGVNSPFNLSSNSTTGSNLFRAEASTNRFKYVGTKTRSFQMNATMSVRANSANIVNQFFVFFFRKNGTTTLVPTNTVVRFGSYGPGADIESVAISGTVDLAPGEYIEVWGQRITGGTISSQELAIFSFNLNVK